MKRTILLTGMIAMIMQLLIVVGPSDPAAAEGGPVDPGHRWGWGENGQYELGDGTNTDRTEPTQLDMYQWTHLTGGEHHACGIRDNGRLYCWGDNSYGQLGDGTTTDRFLPTQVSGSYTDWSYVTAGGAHTCGIRTNGRLYCWGYNGEGQVGDGTTATNRDTPTQVSGSYTDWTHVSAGYEFTCGIRTSGRLYCWGDNAYYQVGDGTTTDRNMPTEVDGSYTDWAHISAGSYHACGIRTSGRLYCWGDNDDGAIGDGSTTDRSTPTQVSGSHSDWAHISSGYYMTCGIRMSGRLYCWGYNDSGQVGDGTTTDRTTPTEVDGSYTDWQFINTGVYSAHVCGIRSGDALYCWGDNEYYQIGDGTDTDRTSPVWILPGAKFELVAFAEYSTIAITKMRICDGEPVTIDMNLNGGNGNGTSGDDVIIGTPFDDTIKAGAGDDLVCAGQGDDTVRGQAGNDILNGGQGEDKLRGGADDDWLYGGSDADDVAGGTGDDHVYGDSGADKVVRGGVGDDHVYGGTGDDLLVAGNGGEDRVYGDDGNDVLVTGGPRPDYVYGGDGDDVLKGNKGADYLYGDDGNDELLGGDQPDVLDGGANTDTCKGGTTTPATTENDTTTNCENISQVP